MKRLLLISLLLLSRAQADTPAQISTDYHRQEALALAGLNQTLEKATTPLIASLIASGDTPNAEKLTAQLKAKQAGEPVPTPHSSATLLFAQYDQARAKVLEPVQKSAIARIDAMLKRQGDLKLETVTELGKIRAEIAPPDTAAPAEASTAASPPPEVTRGISDLVKKLGGKIKESSDGDTIDFSRATITTQELLAIGADKRLKSFNWLSGDGLTDEGMAAFAGMTSLDNLYLWGVGRITDAGLAHLAGCKRLEVLNIGANGTELTGTGLENLAQCKSLRKLNLNYLSKLDGSNLRHLSNLKSLKLLYLASCRSIKDADMEVISQMTQLTNLDVARTGVTDAGLAKLTSLTQLQELIVSEPLVTKAGAEVLTKARPGLKVTFTK